ncbi:HAD-IIIC family phosphatase [Nonomuraea guangzhouensis]|uniref:HAD-IIIC family phosphatase n=1 Tax=Nonomuraea guangzhouensis TaxID=1291555 RepID=A0ABW4FXZ9_9ACTN|nr:HAD-IIIC family phosphatase [Nonomuraea guangzhouensis]
MNDLLARVRRLALPGAEPDPELLELLSRTPDLAAAREAGRLLAKVRACLVTPPGRAPDRLRVAVAASFTCDAVPPLLRIELLRAGIDAELHVTGADELLIELTDPGSGLAAFAPQITLCLLDEGMFLPYDADPADLAGLREQVLERAELFRTALRGFRARSGESVLIHTVPLPASRLRSVIAYRSRAALGGIWRALNTRLLDLAEELESVHVMDLESLLTDHPDRLRDERLHHFARMAWSPSVERLYAQEAAGFCRAVAGRSAKCLVLDLDNTLWGGVLGDDGPENIEAGPLYPGNAYLETQRTALALRRQGVLLAISSKNDQALVTKVFDEHPAFALRNGDFAASAVNWADKAGNIAALAAELNIGLDSVVFADDSRFECEQVRHALPEVTVVHLSGDPSEHARQLLAEGHFDVPATTSADRQRTALYQAQVQRRHWEAETEGSLRRYLHGLDLRVTVRAADDYMLPRIHQLGLRTNQFTLLGRSHPEARTREMAGSDACRVLGFEVADRFGPEGVVGAVWISRAADHWLLENYVMSCRVFSRGIEFAVLQSVVDQARAAGVARIEADHRPTGRNGPARRFLLEAGFTADREAEGLTRYVLPLDPPPALHPDWITLESEDRHAVA